MSPTPDQEASREYRGKYPPRPGRPGTAPEPYLTPEMIQERETAHLKNDERVAAALNQKSPPPVIALDDDTLKALVAARGWTLLTEETHGGSMATLESKVAELEKRNDALVKSSADLQARAQLAEASAASALKELGDLKAKVAEDLAEPKVPEALAGQNPKGKV